MTIFLRALPVVLNHEGGWCIDQGGPTMRGISLNWLRTVEPEWDAESLRAMSIEETRRIYYQYFWHFDGIANALVATKLFDMSVNMGHHQAMKLAQRAANVLGAALSVDGVLGPLTTTALNERNASDLLLELVHQQIAFYRMLAAKNPARHGASLKGWLKRAAWPWSRERPIPNV